MSRIVISGTLLSAVIDEAGFYNTFGSYKSLGYLFGNSKTLIESKGNDNDDSQQVTEETTVYLSEYLIFPEVRDVWNKSAVAQEVLSRRPDDVIGLVILKFDGNTSPSFREVAALKTLPIRNSSSNRVLLLINIPHKDRVEWIQSLSFHGFKLDSDQA